MARKATGGDLTRCVVYIEPYRGAGVVEAHRRIQYGAGAHERVEDGGGRVDARQLQEGGCQVQPEGPGSRMVVAEIGVYLYSNEAKRWVCFAKEAYCVGAGAAPSGKGCADDAIQSLIQRGPAQSRASKGFAGNGVSARASSFYDREPAQDGSFDIRRAHELAEPPSCVGAAARGRGEDVSEVFGRRIQRMGPDLGRVLLHYRGVAVVESWGVVDGTIGAEFAQGCKRPSRLGRQNAGTGLHPIREWACGP